jgi:hypothetical protein
MKVFYTILLFLFLSVGFAQNSKLKGVWVEYKREIASTNQEINPKSEELEVYEFNSDYTYSTPQSYAVNMRHDVFDYYELHNDTIYLYRGATCDCGMHPLLYKYTFHYKANKIDYLTLTDITKENKNANIYYLRRARKLPKTINKTPTTIQYPEKPKRFPRIKSKVKQKEIIGDWYEYKTEIINEPDYKKYTFKGAEARFNHYVSFNLNNSKSNNYDEPKNANFQIIGDSVYLFKLKYQGDVNINLNYIDTVKYTYKNKELIWQENNSSEQISYLHYFNQEKNKSFFKDTLRDYRYLSERQTNYPGGKDSLYLFAKKLQGINPDTPIGNSELVNIKIYFNIYGDIIYAQPTSSKNRKISLEKAMRIVEQMPQWEPALEKIGAHAYKKTKFSTIINVPIY